MDCEICKLIGEVRDEPHAHWTPDQDGHWCLMEIRGGVLGQYDWVETQEKMKLLAAPVYNPNA